MSLPSGVREFFKVCEMVVGVYEVSRVAGDKILIRYQHRMRRKLANLKRSRNAGLRSSGSQGFVLLFPNTVFIQPKNGVAHTLAAFFILNFEMLSQRQQSIQKGFTRLLSRPSRCFLAYLVILGHSWPFLAKNGQEWLARTDPQHFPDWISNRWIRANREWLMPAWRVSVISATGCHQRIHQ